MLAVGFRLRQNGAAHENSCAAPACVQGVMSRFWRGLMRLTVGTIWLICLRRARGVPRWGRGLVLL